MSSNFVRRTVVCAALATAVASTAWATNATPFASDQDSVDWRAANDAVGALLRGHLDVLRWERQNRASQAASTDAPPPAALTQWVGLALNAHPELLAMSSASELERAQLKRRTRLLALQVERAWLKAASARRHLALQSQAVSAAQVAADLARRMAQLGNWNEQTALRHTLVLEQARAAQAVAELDAESATLALWSMLKAHLSPADLANALPLELPALPERGGSQASEAKAEMQALIDEAKRQHPVFGLREVSMQRLKRTANAGLLKAAEQDLKRQAQTPADEWPAQWRMSPNAVKDVHEDVYALAEHERMGRVIEAAVRQAWLRWETAEALAQDYAKRQVALNVRLEELAVQEYNGMFKSTWDLLATARARIAALMAENRAQEQAWLANLSLRSVLAGGNAIDASVSAGAAPASAEQGH